MSTPETSLTASSGASELATTGADSTPAPTTPAGGEELGLTPATTPTAIEGSAAPPAWESIVSSIPENDDDISQPTYQHVTGLQEQRKQLRTLAAAIKELQPAQQRLAAYQDLGEPTAIKSAVELTNLLYSPVVDQRTGQPLIDPATQTQYVTTKPMLEYLDQYSPGMPEQLLVDLLDFEPTDENGQKTPKLKYQVLRHWGLDPARMSDYQAIDSQPAIISRAVSAEELKDVPTEYHEAYRNLPPSIRNAWVAYDEADQLVMLRNEKARLDLVANSERRDKEDKARKEQEDRAHLALLDREIRGYLDTVRRERFASIAEALSKLVFTTDETTNIVMRGSVSAVIANLIDPDLRFVSEGLLNALGVKLDHTFDEALNSFNTNARKFVAEALQGDELRASQSQEKANTAANLLTTKLGIIALKVAKTMGGQQQAAAAVHGQQLATAVNTRPFTGNGTAPNGEQGILPPNIRPGTPEAARYLAHSTGFWPTN